MPGAGPPNTRRRWELQRRVHRPQVGLCVSPGVRLFLSWRRRWRYTATRRPETDDDINNSQISTFYLLFPVGRFSIRPDAACRCIPRPIGTSPARHLAPRAHHWSCLRRPFNPALRALPQPPHHRRSRKTPDVTAAVRQPPVSTQTRAPTSCAKIEPLIKAAGHGAGPILEDRNAGS